MALDQSYLDAIKSFEGYNPQSQWDYKQYSSGFGTKVQPGDENIPPDQRQAVYEQRFQGEVGKAAQSVDSFAPDLPQGVRAALTSLTYNAGPGWQQSGLGAAIKAGDWDKAKDIFLQYNKAGGEVNPGLVARRQKEAAWFGGGQAPQASPAGLLASAPQAAPQPPISLPAGLGAQPYFPPQQAPQSQQAPLQIETPQAPPIFYAPRKPIDLSALRAAFAAPTFRQG